MNRETAKKAESRRKFSVLVYAIGAIIGVALIGVTVYADLEAFLIDVTFTTDGTIRPVSCPIFLDSEESGLVSATYKNRTGDVDEILAEAQIYHGQLAGIREEETTITLEPGEKNQFTWEVIPSDTSDQHFILTKVILSGSRSETAYKGSCGTIILNLPGRLSGMPFFWLLFSFVTICLWGGMGIWLLHRHSYTRQLEATGAIVGLGIFIQVGLIAAAIGFWEMAAFSFYVIVLLIGVIVPHFFVRRKKT